MNGRSQVRFKTERALEGATSSQDKFLGTTPQRTMTDEAFYQAIWEIAERFVGDGPECEALTNELWELVLEDAKDGARQRSRAQMAGFMMGQMWGR